MASTHSADVIDAARSCVLEPDLADDGELVGQPATQRAFSALAMGIVPLETSTWVAPSVRHSVRQSSTMPATAKRSNSVPPK